MLAQIVVLCLVLGRASSVSHVSIAWDFDVRLDDHDQPQGKVWLLVDRERHLLTDNPIAGYRIVARSDYEQSQIPTGAVSACTAWYAGLGEDILRDRGHRTCKGFQTGIW